LLLFKGERKKNQAAPWQGCCCGCLAEKENESAAAAQNQNALSKYFFDGRVSENVPAEKSWWGKGKIFVAPMSSECLLPLTPCPVEIC
jgi:hypothetical protein